MNKHKHYDMMIEWAADTSRPVECRRPGGGWSTLTTTPVWDESIEYRFADSVLRYRVALFYDGLNHWTSTSSNQNEAAAKEKLTMFVRWLTDWIEVTDPPVEEPKPRLKYEVWLVLTPTGQRIVFDDEPNANAYATRHSSEVRHIEWEAPE